MTTKKTSAVLYDGNETMHEASIFHIEFQNIEKNTEGKIQENTSLLGDTNDGFQKLSIKLKLTAERDPYDQLVT